MCFGYDGDAALERSLATQGARRRQVLLGGAGAAGAALALTGGAAQAAGPGTGKGKGPGKGPGRDKDRDKDRGKGRRRVPGEQISIQLYTLRDALGGEPGFDTVLRRLAQYGYERVELAGYYGRTARQLRTFLDGLGIRATSSHDGISPDRSALSTKLENARVLGQRYLNVPYLDSRDLADWQRWADQMNEEARTAQRWGLRYGYHNHAHEFTTDLGGGRTPWDVLTERLDPRYVHLELDLYWAYTAGVNLGERDPDRFALDVIGQARQRTVQFHVKDRDATTGDMSDLGTGVVDFARIFAGHRVEEYIVENDTPDVTPLTSAAVGRCYLDHLEY